MSIAYIVDGTTKLPLDIKNSKDVFVLPFKAYNGKGTLIDLFDSKKIKELQNLENKQVIEPTPGAYRDMYNSLIKQGYDYVVRIPQSDERSNSFFNASYAKRITDINGVVINVKDLELAPLEVLTQLLLDNYIEEETTNHQIDLDYFINLIMNAINSIKLVVT